jgi:uncharacterized protein (TIGR02145 family)
VSLLFVFEFTGLHAQTVKDIDGNVYKTVKIGAQEWMAENLRTTKYNDGTAIPNITDNTKWGALTTGAYCDYNNTPSNSNKYGRLYNWYAVDNNNATKGASNGGKNVCPTGWHVPSDAEWSILTDYLKNNGYGTGGTGGNIAKSMAAPSGWDSDPTAGNVGNDQASNNRSGFTAIPNSTRGSSNSFGNVGGKALWWSSTEYGASNVWTRVMYNYSSNIIRYNYIGKRFGVPVRCLKVN